MDEGRADAVASPELRAAIDKAFELMTWENVME